MAKNVIKELKKYCYGYKKVNEDEYSLLVFWETSSELKDLLSVDAHIHLGDMDDVKMLHKALGRLIRDWDNKET